MIAMLRALWSWVSGPTQVYEVTSTELAIALRRAGYTGSVQRYAPPWASGRPAPVIRRCASKPCAR